MRTILRKSYSMIHNNYTLIVSYTVHTVHTVCFIIHIAIIGGILGEIFLTDIDVDS